LGSIFLPRFCYLSGFSLSFFPFSFFWSFLLSFDWSKFCEQPKQTNIKTKASLLGCWTCFLFLCQKCSNMFSVEQVYNSDHMMQHKKSFFYFYGEVLIPIALLFSFYPRKHSYSLYWVGSGWWCRGHVTQCTSFSFKYSGDLYLMKIRKINIENKYVPCTSDAFGAPVYIFVGARVQMIVPPRHEARWTVPNFFLP
jgi:hypothetical protein